MNLDKNRPPPAKVSKTTEVPLETQQDTILSKQNEQSASVDRSLPTTVPRDALNPGAPPGSKPIDEIEALESRNINKPSATDAQGPSKLKELERAPFAIIENPLTLRTGPGSTLRKLENHFSDVSGWKTFIPSSTEYRNSKFIPDLNSGLAICNMINAVLRNNAEFARAVPDYCSLELNIGFQILAILKISRLEVKRYENSSSDLRAMARKAENLANMYYHIPAPLAAFLDQLGHINPVDGYGEVSPRLPDLGVYNQAGNMNVQHPAGILRLGLLPLQIQFLRNIKLGQHLGQIHGRISLDPIFPAAPLLQVPLNGQCFGIILGMGQLGYPWTFATTPADLVSRMQHGNANALPPPDMTPVSYSRFDNFCGLASQQDHLWLHALLARISTASKFFKDSSPYNPITYHGLPPMLLECRDNRDPVTVNNFNGNRAPYLLPHQTTPYRTRRHFQKVGTESDFKIGTVCGINTIYHGDTSPLLSRQTEGPYFDLRAQDPQVDPPVIKYQLHATRLLDQLTPSCLPAMSREIRHSRLSQQAA